VLDCSDEESYALLDKLYTQHLYTKENLYEHHWQLGDLVIWDNLTLQHSRREAPLSKGERTMRRVTICRHSDPRAKTLSVDGKIEPDPVGASRHNTTCDRPSSHTTVTL
jgi:alpha-ketoglutarate-dependent taurine dioxygenase